MPANNEQCTTSDDDKVAQTGAIIGGTIGLGTTCTTGALQTFFAASQISTASISAFTAGIPASVSLPVFLPIGAGALAGGVLFWGAYKLYGFLTTPILSLAPSQIEQEKVQSQQLHPNS